MKHSSLETLQACPVCAHPDFSDFLSCKDHTVTQERFSIVVCRHCGFRFTNPRPVEDAIGKYYESEDYVAHSNTNKGLINRVYQIVRNHTIRRKFKLVSSLSTGNTILDYGCATGEFLNFCKSKGWNTTGLEPSLAARTFAQTEYQLQLQSEDELTNLPDKSFSVITLWHVLEHVHRLKDLLAELTRLLAPKGLLLIAVPNCSSKDAQLYQEFWAAYDVPRHLYHFRPEDIIRLLEEAGLELTGTRPMKFDAYYVSLLSEKYKNGSRNLLRAFFNGWRSNLSATNSEKIQTYSSQIYLFRAS